MEEKPNIWKTGLNSGLIIGLILVIYSFILHFTGLHTNRLLGNLSFLILVVGIIWAHGNYKKIGNGFMDYGTGLGLGTIISGVTGVINGLFVVIYMKLIDPGIMERALQEQIIALQDRGMTQADTERFQDIMVFMQSPIALFLISLLSFIFFGFLLSLIVSAFTKKTDPDQGI
jgi:hypothetical protein